MKKKNRKKTVKNNVIIKIGHWKFVYKNIPFIYWLLTFEKLRFWLEYFLANLF